MRSHKSSFPIVNLIVVVINTRHGVLLDRHDPPPARPMESALRWPGVFVRTTPKVANCCTYIFLSLRPLWPHGVRGGGGGRTTSDVGVSTPGSRALGP